MTCALSPAIEEPPTRGDARLTWAVVREIRHRKFCPTCKPWSSNVDMAIEYGVSPVMIHFIVRGTRWRDPKPPKSVECPSFPRMAAMLEAEGYLVSRPSEPFADTVAPFSSRGR